MGCLRYWVGDMHVDGFRFDLASALARSFHDVDMLGNFLTTIQQDPVLRRVKRLRDAGLIEKQVAILRPQRLADAIGHGLTALVEITLDQQHHEALVAFEAKVATEPAVQQCYRVSPGPDFVLVVHTKDMPGYQALTQRLFTQDANVRNVKTFFSVHRSKFGAELPLA